MAPASHEQPARCPFCNELGAIIPGESYQADDVVLFERIESIVHVRQLTRVTSHGLWATLSNVSERARRPDLLLLPVVDAMPALQFIQESFARDRAQLARAAGMILAAVTAHLRALEARQSVA